MTWKSSVGWIQYPPSPPPLAPPFSHVQHPVDAIAGALVILADEYNAAAAAAEFELSGPTKDTETTLADEAASAQGTPAERLKILWKLLEQGLITEEEPHAGKGQTVGSL